MVRTPPPLHRAGRQAEKAAGARGKAYHRAMTRRTFAALAIVVASCALPDDFVKVDATSTSGGGAMGGSGGGGGTSDGGGGAPPCDDTVQNTCAGVQPLAYGGSGFITPTDMAFVSGSVASVGVFSGTVDFAGPQLSAGGRTVGFLVEHDAGGSFVAQLALAEATEGSVLAVTYGAVPNQYAVGGTYDGGACGAGQGVFVRRLVRNGDTYDDVHPPVCIPTTATSLEIGGIAMSESGAINLAGALVGTIDGQAADSEDGFMVDVDPMGVPDVFLVGGSGDAALHGIVPNEADENQWLIAGDFSGELVISFPSDGGPVTESRTAEGARDLFVAAIDRFPMNPQLDVRAMGAAGGYHRVVTLADDPATVGRMHLAAMIEGTLDVGTTVSSDERPSALVLTFVAPDDIATPYAYVDHYVLSADQLEVIDMVGAVGRVHLGGHASGELSVTRAGEAPFVYESNRPCLFDAFLMTLQPTNMSTAAGRCGDGQQTFHAIGRYTDTLFAASLTVPAGGSIDLGDGITTEPAQRTFLLREP
jgi:hypothetical protein